ncbi:MAG: RHS repeat-associated core domain-containing protein [Proteobacteria bacterium]|nr:RHS repeat-associated core domain-containing protein [Pseudomonadota bacterium]MBS0498837.1 RHS repeat-associated core domain-containing protein [Pseudomonadota bacterium]
MSGFTYGNGIVHTLTQNTRELPLRSLDQKPGQSAILDDTYTYDANGNVKGIADGTAGNANSRTMAYDGLDRLTGTSAPHQWWISAATTYDALDNIRANQVGNTATYLNTFSYDPTTWHLTAIAGHVNWALAYDANGNVTSKGTGNDSYAFDAANRLTSVTGKESYRYDGYGRRVKITRSTDGKIDYPVYDRGGQLLTEDDQRSNQTTDYVSLNGSLVARRASPIGTNQWTTTYEHTDALRSPRYETSATGTLTRAELYTPWGEPGDGKYVQGPGYTGHVTDAATHLTYAQQRYYDPVMGRFLSTDPVQASDSGASFNRYWYANNNPYKFTDPDGRCADGASCDQMVQSYGAWANANPAAADKLAENVGFPAVAVMLAATGLSEVVGAVKTVSMIKNALTNTPKATVRTPGEAFFEGTTLADRVAGQMKKGDNHAFPHQVDGFAARDGKVSTAADSRGNPVQMLTVKGGYKGREGTFEYIKNQSNEIYHRFFNPDRAVNATCAGTCSSGGGLTITP